MTARQRSGPGEISWRRTCRFAPPVIGTTVLTAACAERYAAVPVRARSAWCRCAADPSCGCAVCRVVDLRYDLTERRLCSTC
jgi:hypothetical protein